MCVCVCLFCMCGVVIPVFGMCVVCVWYVCGVCVWYVCGVCMCGVCPLPLPHEGFDGGGLQYVGPSWPGGILCHPPVLPLQEHTVPCCLEYGGRGQGY